MPVVIECARKNNTGKELVTFAERHGAIISQHIWEALTDLDKCAPKPVVENCHSTQQLKAEIRAMCIELECTTHDKFDSGMYHALRGRLRELSAV